MIESRQPDTPPRVSPRIADENRAFWSGGSGGQLLIARCCSCNMWVHPPTRRCPDCGGETRPEAVSGKGEVFTFTVNRHTYRQEVPPPYVVALVELDEQPGLRLTTNVVNCHVDEVEIGMRVRVVFERAGDDVWVPVFEPDT